MQPPRTTPHPNKTTNNPRAAIFFFLFPARLFGAATKIL
jgi:hypothetical protein